MYGGGESEREGKLSARVLGCGGVVQIEAMQVRELESKALPENFAKINSLAAQRDIWKLVEGAEGNVRG